MSGDKVSSETLPDHFPLSPSGMSRILACPGSREISRGLESRETSYAREGTVAHKLGAAMLLGEAVTPPRLCNRCNAETSGAACELCGSPEYRLDAEMLENLQEYVATIDGIRATYELVDELIEHKVASERIDELGGTMDYLAIYREGGADDWGGPTSPLVAHVVDLKYGQGVIVEAAGNSQLLTYLLLARERCPAVEGFRMTVVQPRAAGRTIATVDVTAEELDAHEAAIRRATTLSTLSPGDHCRWCAGKQVCPALRDQALAAAQAAFTEARPATSPLEENLELWLDLLSKEDAITQYLSEIRQRLLAEAERGVAIPGYKVVARTGNRAWVGTEDEVAAMLMRRKDPHTNKRLGKKNLYVPKLKTPAQFDREGLGPVISDLVGRSDLGYRLVPITAPGRPVEFTTPGDMFAAAEVERSVFELLG